MVGGDGGVGEHGCGGSGRSWACLGRARGEAEGGGEERTKGDDGGELFEEEGWGGEGSWVRHGENPSRVDGQFHLVLAEAG